MNELFAIEPTAFDDYKDLNYLLSKFGFYEGRFVAEYPHDWVKQVILHLNILPEIERSRAVSLLRRFKDDHLIQVGLKWKYEQNWIENASKQKQSKFVNEVIVARNHRGEFISPDDVDDSYFHENWCGRQSRVKSTAEDYASAASMLLRSSHEVAIIDPYISTFDDRWKRVINKFAAVAIQGKCRRFIVFSFDKNSDTAEMVQKGSRYFFGDAIKLGMKISYYLLQDTKNTKADDHARYLLSKKGAMHFDKGFDEDKPARLRMVGVLDKPMHTELCNQYFEGEDALPFRIMHSFHYGEKPLAGAL